jgi:hypothetical protein
MSEPKIVAQFTTDSQGEPQYLKGKSRKHYVIRLFLENAPSDVSRVTYKLPESYRQPVREVPVGVPKFGEEITSFGDYTVTAMLRRRAGTDLVTNSLSAALTEGYRGRPLTPGLLEAIDGLRSE